MSSSIEEAAICTAFVSFTYNQLPSFILNANSAVKNLLRSFAVDVPQLILNLKFLSKFQTIGVSSAAINVESSNVVPSSFSNL